MYILLLMPPAMRWVNLDCCWFWFDSNTGIKSAKHIFIGASKHQTRSMLIILGKTKLFLLFLFLNIFLVSVAYSPPNYIKSVKLLIFIAFNLQLSHNDEVVFSCFFFITDESSGQNSFYSLHLVLYQHHKIIYLTNVIVIMRNKL